MTTFLCQFPPGPLGFTLQVAPQGSFSRTMVCIVEPAGLAASQHVRVGDCLFKINAAAVHQVPFERAVESARRRLFLSVDRPRALDVRSRVFYS